MNRMKTDSAAREPSLSIARQPVFDRKGQLWGYEVFFVGSASSACPAAPNAADMAAVVESSAYIGLQRMLQGKKKLFADYSGQGILDRLPYVLPSGVAVIRVCEQESGNPPVMEALASLKEEGYAIAVRGFTGNGNCEPLYRIADILAVEVDGLDGETIGRRLAAAREYSPLSLAHHVPDRGRYEQCRELGFSLFHGAFFKSPDKVTVRRLSSNEVLRFKLLEQIEKNNPDVDHLAEIIQSDATISFRLLTYLNSALFAFSRKIQSIHQAIVLLGWDKIKNWLRVLLLTDMSPSKDARELVLLSAQRGRFLEMLARDYDYWGFDPNSLHMLGLFSLMDALLDLPMQEILAGLPIDEKMKSALCREPNNEYLPLLRLAEHLEEGKWEEADRLIRQLNLDRDRVVAALHNSIHWAGELDLVHSGNVGESGGLS